MRLCAAAAIACAARPAAAERPIVVDAQGVPFAAGDLADAIRVRVARDGRPLRVRVTAVDHGVKVEAQGGVREIDLAGLSGPAAARLVALAANDMLLDDLATAPTAPVHPRSTLSIVGSGARWDHALGGATIDLAIPVARGLVAIEAGAGDVLGGNVQLVAGVVRVDAGVRASWLELRAGATVMPLVVTTGGGDTTVLVGAGASARVRVPVVEGVHAVIAGGADVFATRTHYQLAGATAFATPSWAPWLALGLEVAL